MFQGKFLFSYWFLIELKFQKPKKGRKTEFLKVQAVLFNAKQLTCRNWKKNEKYKKHWAKFVFMMEKFALLA